MTRGRTAWFVALAVVGLLATLHMMASTDFVGSPPLSSLPERHLQTPWWEAVTTASPSSGVMKVTIPAALLFAYNSSNISPSGVLALRRLTPDLNGATRINVAGCTDAVGGVDSAFNVSLSWRRASAARIALVRLGVPRNLFRLSALADTRPATHVAGLDRATIDALNRRVIVTIFRKT